jgi:hypothetical protein
MRKTWLPWLAAALAAAPAWAQDPPRPDDKFRPEAPQKEDEEDLTPEKAMAMLKEVRELMEKSEELLNTSSRGKALETEKEVLERIKELLKDDPQATQKQILEKIERLMSKSEGQQKDAVERLAEIIRKAKS